tara:strand:- start:2300 stop:2749 length:450 start_codon:yes stop_codon:yes gene_type:complete
MATNNVINGTLAVLKTGTTAGGHAAATAIALSTSASLSLSMETRDISNKSSAGWRELLEAQKSWSASCEGMYAMLDSAGTAVKNYDDFFALLIARTPMYIEINTGVTGDKYYYGECYITSLEQTAPLEDNMTYSMSFEGTAALTEGTQA